MTTWFTIRWWLDKGSSLYHIIQVLATKPHGGDLIVNLMVMDWWTLMISFLLFLLLFWWQERLPVQVNGFDPENKKSWSIWKLSHWRLKYASAHHYLTKNYQHKIIKFKYKHDLCIYYTLYYLDKKYIHCCTNGLVTTYIYILENESNFYFILLHSS